MRKSALLIPVVFVALVAILSSIFIVDERQKALVLQFGRIVSVKENPGMSFKWPMIQEIVYYDDRILSRDVKPKLVTPSDRRYLIVDAFARYRIADPIQFRKAVSFGGIPKAEELLDGILVDKMRAVLGSVTSNEILSSDRVSLMLRIRNEAIPEARKIGLEVIDVRLKRTDLPRENLNATFARMRAEREREATDERARGDEAARRVKALADRNVIELVSDAERQSQIIRGEADAKRNAIFAEAYGEDKEFFEFYRSLSAYRQSLKGSNTTMVMSPDSAFFNYLKSDSGQ